MHSQPKANNHSSLAGRLNRSILTTGGLALVISVFSWAGVVWAGAPDEPALHSLQPPVELPDGSEFKTWEVSPQFSRTYYVSQNNPHASDANPGTPEAPFLTISHAAQILQPGERVVIGTGLYRECVRPARGGSDPTKMISYETAPGAQVIISGAEVYTGAWQPVAQSPGVWQAELPAQWFTGANPFALKNLPQSMIELIHERQRRKGKRQRRFAAADELRCGLVFQDGRRLVQERQETDLHPGTYFVQSDGRSLLVCPYDSTNPNSIHWEMTAREQCFAPLKQGLGYIRVKGLTIEMGGNPFPLPQLGLLSTNSGNHWLIEENTVRWANSIGIDIGRPTARADGAPGFGQQIVRHNIVTDCGINGITGMGVVRGGGFRVLVTDNILQRNAWQDAESNETSAAIKLLLLSNSVVARNLISATFHGPAIWLDNGNSNDVCRGNVILNTTARSGAIMIELSDVPNLVVSNVIWQCTGAGFYEHDSKNQIVRDNFIAHTAGPGIFLHGQVSPRPQHGVGHHLVTGNVLFATKEPIKAVAPDNTITGNITQGITATLDAAAGQLTWQAPGHPGQIIDFHALTAESK